MYRPITSFFIGGGPVPPPAFPPLSFPFLPSLPLFPALPLKSSEGVLGALKAPHWDRAEPGLQTHFGAIEGQNSANHVNKLACSQHMPINIMLRCAVGSRDPLDHPFVTGLMYEIVTLGIVTLL